MSARLSEWMSAASHGTCGLTNSGVGFGFTTEALQVFVVQSFLLEPLFSIPFYSLWWLSCITA